MKIEIWSDIACPWCYVGKRRFESAVAQFEHRDELEVTWRSFELDPSSPRAREGSQLEHLAAKYGMPLAQAEAMNARMTDAAAGEGLDFHLDRVRMGNTFDAHRLVHLAHEAGLQDAMKERLMRAYFVEGLAITEVDVLVALGVEVGLDEARVRSVLADEEFSAAVRTDEARARALGINGVPFFVIDERYGVSGAQPAEVLLGALRQAHGERSVVMVGGAGDADAQQCGEDGCEV